MDSLKRPLRVPPDFSLYAEHKGIFQLYERMLQELIVAKPVDPLAFLAQYLSRQQDDGMYELTKCKGILREDVGECCSFP